MDSMALLGLTDEELKDFLRLGFAYGGLDTALSDTFDECALLIRPENRCQPLRPPFVPNFPK